jgi:hypothetical protein
LSRSAMNASLCPGATRCAIEVAPENRSS